MKEDMQTKEERIFQAMGAASMVIMNEVGVNLARLKKKSKNISVAGLNKLRKERQEMRSDRHAGVAKSSSCTFRTASLDHTLLK